MNHIVALFDTILYTNIAHSCFNFPGHDNLKSILLSSPILTVMPLFSITIYAINTFWSNLFLFWIPKPCITCPMSFAYAWSVLYYFTMHSQSHKISAYIACPIIISSWSLLFLTTDTFYSLYIMCYVLCWVLHKCVSWLYLRYILTTAFCITQPMPK